jgi:uncharacterized protein (TIGR03790 family)
MKNLFTLTTLAFALNAIAADPGSEVAVVFNTRVPESKQVAEHYAEVRRVPKTQVIGLDLPVAEAISRADYRKQLELPLVEALAKRKLLELSSKARPKNAPVTYSPTLRASIRYIVLCYGVPLKITADATIKEPEFASVRPELQRNEASVDSELALLPAHKEHQLSGPIQNPFYGQTNASVFTAFSNILMVTRLDGPTAEIALRLVDKAREAETNGLLGRAYFDARGLTNGEYQVGDEWMKTGALIARAAGYETILDEKPDIFGSAFPMSQIALYAGWYEGEVAGPFTRPNVEFMPGAFAYHLHSYSATTIRSATRHWVGPLLAKGATITFGAVEEPYLIGTPNIAVFMDRLLWKRFTFGEAAYAAQQVLSWQITFVGDPLYRPMNDVNEPLRLIERKETHIAEWAELRILNRAAVGGGVNLDQSIAYFQEQPITRKSAVLEEKLGDLFREKKNFAAAMIAYNAATKLNPSPLQNVRVLLKLTELATIANDKQQAFDTYKQLIASAPDYPNLPMIYSQAISIGRSLGKTNEVEKLEAEAKRLGAPAK